MAYYCVAFPFEIITVTEEEEKEHKKRIPPTNPLVLVTMKWQNESGNRNMLTHKHSICLFLIFYDFFFCIHCIARLEIGVNICGIFMTFKRVRERVFLNSRYCAEHILVDEIEKKKNYEISTNHSEDEMFHKFFKMEMKRNKKKI